MDNGTFRADSKQMWADREFIWSGLMAEPLRQIK